MNISEELKHIVIHESKSAYHKLRLVGAVAEKSMKFVTDKGKFAIRFAKELQKK